MFSYAETDIRGTEERNWYNEICHVPLMIAFCPFLPLKAQFFDGTKQCLRVSLAVCFHLSPREHSFYNSNKTFAKIKSKAMQVNSTPYYC